MNSSAEEILLTPFVMLTVIVRPLSDPIIAVAVCATDLQKEEAIREEAAPNLSVYVSRGKRDVDVFTFKGNIVR